MVIVVPGSDVNVAISDAEVVGLLLVEIMPDCEGLNDEGATEASSDMDDGVLREQLHSDQYHYQPSLTSQTNPYLKALLTLCIF